MSVDLEPAAPSLRKRGSAASGSGRRAVALHSWALPAAPLDPLAVFQAARRQDALCCYWEQPADGMVMVGLGAAFAIDVGGPDRFQEAQDLWARLRAGAVIEGGAHGGPRLLGGFAFDTDSPDRGLWDGFPAGRLILPRLLYTRRGAEATLTCNVQLPDNATARHARRGLEDEWDAVSAAAGDGISNARGRFCRGGFQTRPYAPSSATGVGTDLDTQVASLEELPDAATWKDLVASATQAMRAEAGAYHDNALQKVVLARAVRLRAREPFDAVATLHRLRAAGPSRFLFAFSIGEQCFLGATPERLVRLEAGRVETAAVAGSRPRGAGAGEDSALAEDLLQSAKDRWEHDLVAQAVARSLRAVGVDVPSVPEPDVLRLPTVQHLCTPFTGRVRNGTTILDLVERLHPTPAVGGSPRRVALDWLRANEGLDRGWYAGPVGWLDASGNGDFAVAIRSALLRGDEATLFAGCGVVADSDPEAEYEESWLKLRPMLAALGNQR